MHREQAEISAKQQDELRKERAPTNQIAADAVSNDPVADAWRRAQDEAEAAKRGNRRAQAIREQGGSIQTLVQESAPSTLRPDYMAASAPFVSQPTAAVPMSPLINTRAGAGVVLAPAVKLVGDIFFCC